MAIEDIFEMVTWGQVVFDPWRDRLYFTEQRPDKRTNRMTQRIMAVDADGTLGHAIPITTGPSDHHPTPSPDGKWLAFLSRRSGSVQVWLLPLAGGEATQLTSIHGGVKRFTFAPDSASVVVVASIEDGRLEREQDGRAPDSDATDAELDAYFNRDIKHITKQYYKLDGDGFFGSGRNQLVHVPLDGEMELLTDGLDHFDEPVFSPDGQHLYALHRAYDPEGTHPHITHVHQLSLPERQWTRLPLPDWSISGLSVSPDGMHLAFTASNPDDHGYGLTALYRFDLTRGRMTDLSSHLDRSVGDESSTDTPAASTARPTWRNDAVLVLLSDEGRVMLSEFGEHSCVRLWDEKRVVYDFAVRGDWVALAFSDPTHPSAISLVRFGTSNPSTLFAPVPWDASDGLAVCPVAPEEVFANESDGTRIHTWCLRPATPGPHPTILEIHGGPMAMYGYRYFHEFQCLVQAGYAVVYTNPRGSQGYGHEFCNSIKGQWGDKDYRDVMAGLDAALSTWQNLDATHLGVAGGSYGGFMVNWIVSHTQRFKAGITMRSVVNRFSAMGSSDMGWLRIPQYGTLPWWEEPTPYWQQSPLKYASNIHTPLLIEHQENDYRLPIEQAEQLYSALKYLGRTVEMVLYPDESHGMSRTGKPWHRVDRLRRIIGWFHRYVKEA